MASNGKVAVDKLKIGATVSIKLKDSGSCEGAVYTVDPVTKTVVLFFEVPRRPSRRTVETCGWCRSTPSIV